MKRTKANSVVIRPARIRDIPAILALIDDNSDKILSRTEDELRAIRKSFSVVVLSDEVVGCGCLEIYSKKIAEIRSVAIASKHKGKGYGTILMKSLLRRARKLGIPEILVVTSNRDFFQKLNFHSALNEKYALFWNDPKLVKKKQRAAKSK